MPRSGTTLIEQILSSHKKIHGCGELKFLDDRVKQLLLAKQDDFIDNDTAFIEIYKQYMIDLEQLDFKEDIFTDKMPHNFIYAGIILEAFPNAKIIHVKRDPMAVCFSLYKNYFPASGLGYSYSLHTIISFYKLYENMMDFWHKRYPEKIYELQYEKLTENQEEETKKLLQYCNLEWDEAVLEPHKNTRSVTTASSTQIREKIYKGSSMEWKKYGSFLEPLKKEFH